MTIEDKQKLKIEIRNIIREYYDGTIPTAFEISTTLIELSNEIGEAINETVSKGEKWKIGFISTIIVSGRFSDGFAEADGHT